MRNRLAVTLAAAALALMGNLALAASLPGPLPAMPAAGGFAALMSARQAGIRPAVLELAIPNGMRRAVVHAAPDKEQSDGTAKTVQWLTGPVPSRCQHGSNAAPASHACLVI